MSPLPASNLFQPIIVDLFAGAGGASLGIETAMGRAVDVAVNHSDIAVLQHQANHPNTHHLQSDVFEVDPVSATAGRPVALLWASPACPHFSRARGGRPRENKARSLAWVVVKWARATRPSVICLENVREFEEWGPLTADGQPCPNRKGRTFKRWMSSLEQLGYAVEKRVLNAADYGAPTHRRRLFIIARCDGRPIVWPEKTHGHEPSGTSQHRAGEKQPRIVPQQAGTHGAPDRADDHGSGHRVGMGAGIPGVHVGGPDRPQRLRPYRTAAECIDWSIPCPSIFLTKEEGKALGVKRPLAEKTLKRIAEGIRRYVLENPKPFIVHVQNASQANGCSPVDRPMHTVTSHPKGGGFALATPTLIQSGYGERDGQTPRAPGLDKPLGTVVAGGQKHALVAAFLKQAYTGMVGKPVTDPVPAITAKDHNWVVASHLIHMNHGGKQASGMDEPMRTVTAGGLHAAECRAFLIKYFGCGVGQEASDPLHTVTVRDRFGLVMVEGEPYEIADIGLRMLKPRELARAQGFPDSYKLIGTQSQQVAGIGNSVCPAVAEAIVRANTPDMTAIRDEVAA